jgi:uncharacterized membrane-anchored protein YhcB (DUF1043 family)
MALGDFPKEFLELLKTDEEFRHAVAGLLGLEEILKRLDAHGTILARYGEELTKLREDMNKGFARHDAEIARLREDMVKGFARHDEEIAKLREDMNKLREDMNKGFARHDEELAKLREDMVKGFQRHDEEIAKLREDMVKGFQRHDEEIARLREDMNRGFELFDKRLLSVERDVRQMRGFIERTSLTLEEEAFEVIGGRLARMGVEVALDRLVLPDLEINIYGATDETCIVGEGTTRVGTRIVVELDEKAKELMERHPELTRPKMIKVLYTMWITEEAVEEAKKMGIWVLKATKELTLPPSLNI